METFERRVGAERTLLMLPLNVVVVGEVLGRITAAEASDALERLRARHAFSAVRVHLEEDGGARYLSEGVPRIPVSEVEGGGENSWETRVAAELKTSFPLEHGPLVRCTLVQSDLRTAVLLCGHHAICDGKSLTLLLRDLLRAVAAPDVPIEPLDAPPPIDATTVPNPPRMNGAARWITGLMNRGWAKSEIRFGEADMRRMHAAYWQENDGVTVTARALDEETSARLAARCRAEGVTVNAALWTAFLSAQASVQGNRESYRRRAALAVSTREKLSVPVGEALGFYASSLSLTLPRISGPFWDAARKVHGALRAHLEKTDLFRMLVANEMHPTLLDALYFQKFGFVQSGLAKKLLKKMRWDRVSYGTALTNAGRSDIPAQYGPLTLERVYAPIFYSDVDEKAVGAITACGKLTVTLTCNRETVGAKTGDAVLDAAVRLLQDAASTA